MKPVNESMDEIVKDEISRETIDYISELAKINLEENEKESLSREIKTMLNFVDLISEVDTANFEQISYSNQKNIFRKDIIDNNYTQEDLMKNAPSQVDGYLFVPKILD